MARTRRKQFIQSFQKEIVMYSMKETCVRTGMSYENLKFYCNEGLVPNVKRDAHNYRVFDDQDIKWIGSLNCLKNCGMSLAEGNSE